MLRYSHRPSAAPRPAPRQRDGKEDIPSRPGGGGLGRGWKTRLKPVALALALVAGPAAASDDMKALLAEMKRLADRVEALEKNNRELEKSLTSERLSEKEPELTTRLKAVEFQALSMQKQARQIEALEGITVGASLTGVAQRANREAAAGAAARQSRANYRGDVSVTLPGGEMGDVDGRIFTHFRFGQGNGIGLRPTFTSTPNTTAFETGAGADDSFAILAQAWYQLKVPLPRDGVKANSKEHLHLTFGKIDPFVFFDQNAAADDESTKFLNNAFVHNPLLDSGGDTGADKYGFAPGAILQYVNERNKAETWGLSLGAFGSGAGANFSGSLADPFVIAQADTTWRLSHLPGNYRAYVWSNGRGIGYDGIERRHAGFGMSLDQKASESLTLFGRYGHQVKGKVRFDRALTLGGEIAGNAWGRGADSFGAAFGLLRTAAAYRGDSTTLDLDGDGTLDAQASGSERIAELYYRYRVNGRFELTPDFQVIQRPGGDGGARSVRILGLRAKVGF